MKLTFEIRDPKYKVGDVIKMRVGKNREYEVVFAVHEIYASGEWVMQNGFAYVSFVEREIYTLVSQEQFNKPDGSEWFYPRMVLVLNMEDVEKFSEKISWDKEILPAANESYLEERWKKKNPS